MRSVAYEFTFMDPESEKAWHKFENFQAACVTTSKYGQVGYSMVELSLKKLVIPILAAAYVTTRFFRRSSEKEPSNEDRPRFGSGKMFDKFAAYYDIGNRFMSLGQDQSWRKAMLEEAEMTPDDRLLDLATGSGDVAIAARTPHGCKTIVALDPSVEMLKVARVKAQAQQIYDIDFIEGDAQDMPQFEYGKFTKITMSFGIRNVPDRLKALKEMRRVMAAADSSRLAIMEFSAPPEHSFIGKAAQFFVRHIVPIIGGLITGATEEYRYLEESIFRFPKPPEFAALIEEAGFEMVRTTSHAAGVVRIYIAKPKL
jgi:demethylmenaquinone methyltransferase/2-methoxy-6-polyprenyl-1,4-benzoquinol methylase